MKFELPRPCDAALELDLYRGLATVRSDSGETHARIHDLDHEGVWAAVAHTAAARGFFHGLSCGDVYLFYKGVKNPDKATGTFTVPVTPVERHLFGFSADTRTFIATDLSCSIAPTATPKP